MSRSGSTRPPCQECGLADRVARVVYGLPAPDYEPPEPVVLGGCIVHPDAPAWRCLRCGEWFGRVGESHQPG
ncbi:MAG: hypothetical protein QN193_01770 [Armatimonadota bacterium]|nr:hypothetical protein [Armatimonadota bacterium]MDR7569316.1 hypothetical protein [Armatimonadota bacterium]